LTIERHIADSLVRPFVVMMGDVLANQQVEMFFAERDEIVQALTFNAPDPASDERLHVG